MSANIINFKNRLLRKASSVSSNLMATVIDRQFFVKTTTTMKKLTILLCILLTSIFAFGQEKKFGITLQVSSPSKDDVSLGWYNIDGESIDGYNLKHKSFAGGLLANYNISDETTIRVRFGMTKFFIDEYRDEYLSGVHSVESNKGRQTKTQFAPGIIWKMNKNKLDLFGGFEIPINLHGKFTMDYVYTNTDSLTGSIISDGQQITTLPNGYSFGIGAIMGFNYFPAKWFSLGAEFSPSLLYAKLSGKTTTVNSSTVPSSPTTTYNSQDEDKGFTFYDQRFSINLSLWF
jgi:hypothetical protein